MVLRGVGRKLSVAVSKLYREESSAMHIGEIRHKVGIIHPGSQGGGGEGPETCLRPSERRLSIMCGLVVLAHFLGHPHKYLSELEV